MEIKRIIFGAFGYVYEYRKALAKALLIPIIIIVALDAIPIEEDGVPMMVLLTILPLFIYSILAITTHRIILLGPDSVSEWGVYIPRLRELYFVLYTIGLGLLMIPFGLFFLIPTVGWGIAMVAILYILARLSLVFPAIATDKGWSFSDSWNATRNHQVLMIVVVAIFPFMISIPEQLLSYVPYIELFIALLSAFTMIIIISVLSVAFQVITENGEES